MDFENKGLNTRFVNYLLVVLLIVGVTIFSLVGGASNITLIIGEDSVTVGGLEERECVIAYSDVERTELLDELPAIDEKVNADERGKVISGTCKNSEYGEFELYVDQAINKCMLIETADTTLVFNLEGDSTTEQVFESLTEYITAKK